MDKVKEYKEYIVGSRSFFTGMPEYDKYDSIIDYDILCVYQNSENKPIISKRKTDIWYINAKSKEDLLKIEYYPIFLISPEVVRDFNIKIDDIINLKEKFYSLEKKHIYLTKIYEFIINNNSFKLTTSQREDALKIYLKCRPYLNDDEIEKRHIHKIRQLCKKRF